MRFISEEHLHPEYPLPDVTEAVLIDGFTQPGASANSDAAGNNAVILIEINGAGSEAIQYWDPKLSMFEAYAGVFEKQRQLFALAAEMRRRGHRPCGASALARAHLRQQRLIRHYPKSN